MSKSSLRLTLTTTALVALGIPTAQATTFDFGIVYFLKSQAQFNSVFGTGTTGATFTTPTGGLYEETNTTTKFIANVGTSGATPSLLTEFAQNSNPSAQLVFTHIGTAAGAAAPFAGFALSGNPGAGGGFWQYVQTLNSNSTASPNSFLYQVGGVGTQFALDSIGLANLQGCSCSTGVSIIGLLGGLQVASQSVSIPGNFVGGNGNTGVPASLDIVTLAAGFADVDSVEIVPTGGNVNVNDITISPAAAVPEPSTWAMLLLGFAGLGFAFRQSRRKITFA
jgi:PEP-CTERM motif